MENNDFPFDKTLKVFWGILIFLLIAFLFFYFYGYDFSLDWRLISQSQTQNFDVFSFVKGIFTFNLEGQKYFFLENFVGGEIYSPESINTVIVVIQWLAVCGILAITTYWNRFWFIVLAALTMLMINLLDLDSLGLFGSHAGNKYLSIVMIVLTVGPAYYFHINQRFKPLVIKWGLIAIPSSLFLLICYFKTPHFVDYFIANTHISFSIVTILFIFFVSEEILFLLLYLITQTKGTKNNHVHFIIFGFVYIVVLALYNAKKSIFYEYGLDIINPYFLLVSSIAIALYTIHHKQQLYEFMCNIIIDIRHIFFMWATLAITYFILGFANGNDMSYETMHYIIIYFHFGMAIMFFLYLIFNFVIPLKDGLQVYKIAYKERNFPYGAAKVGGLVVAMGLFFLSDNTALKTLHSAWRSYTGVYYEKKDEIGLANEYYRMAANYGYGSHFANYKLGTYYLNNNDLGEASFRFSQATKRFPSPYSFINLAHTYTLMAEDLKIPGLLHEALTSFPNSPEIKNNLALQYIKSQNYSQASTFLSDTKSSDDWNNALKVNRWSYQFDSLSFENDVELPNLALQTNILAQANKHFDVLATNLSSMALPQPPTVHSIAFLVNAYWNMYSVANMDSIALKYKEAVGNPTMNTNLQHSQAIYNIRKGYVNNGFTQLTHLKNYVTEIEKGFFYNQLGTIALYLDAPLLAVKYYENAEIKAYDNAKLYKCIALLEAERWEVAAMEWQKLVDKDSTFFPLYQKMIPIFDNTNIPTFEYCYYRYASIPLHGWGNIVTQFNSFQNSLIWNKIKNRLLHDLDFESLKKHFAVFEPFLLPAQKDEFRNIENIFVNKPERDLATLHHNAFAEWQILFYLQYGNLTKEQKYELLVRATEINPYSKELLQAYCFAAIDLGLYSYADSGLVSLFELMTVQEYKDFERAYFDATQQKKNDARW